MSESSAGAVAAAAAFRLTQFTFERRRFVIVNIGVKQHLYA